MPSKFIRAHLSESPLSFNDESLKQDKCPNPDGVGLQLFFEVEGKYYLIAGPRAGKIITVNGGKIDDPQASYFDQLIDEFHEETFGYLHLRKIAQQVEQPYILVIEKIGYFEIDIEEQVHIAYKPNGYAYLTFVGIVKNITIEQLETVVTNISATAMYWSMLGGFLANHVFSKDIPQKDSSEFKAYWSQQQEKLNSLFEKMKEFRKENDLRITPEQAFYMETESQAWDEVRQIPDYQALRQLFSHTVGRYSERAGYFLFSASSILNNSKFGTKIIDIHSIEIAEELFNKDLVSAIFPSIIDRKITLQSYPQTLFSAKQTAKIFNTSLDFWKFPISCGTEKNEIGIQKGKFAGNLEKALTAINEFCIKHQIKMKSYGYDYHKLIIENATHDISRYGIDIDMMLRFCGITLEERLSLSQ